MVSPSSILTRAFLAIGIVGSLSFVPALCAQNLPDDAHVTPRTGRQSKVDSDKDPSLQTGSGRIKVNVDLVLLPVSITDLMNRPVTGLEKENFKVFEEGAAGYSALLRRGHPSVPGGDLRHERQHEHQN